MTKKEELAIYGCNPVVNKKFSRYNTIGEEEKSEEYCWVKSHKSVTGDSWADFSKMVLELAMAGYPGSIGCGGPGSEEIWDESKSRIY